MSRDVKAPAEAQAGAIKSERTHLECGGVDAAIPGCDALQPSVGGRNRTPK